MANRTVLEVVVAGDSRSVEQAFKRSERAADKFGKEAEKSSRRSAAAFGAVGKAARTAGPAVGLALGGAVAFAVSNFAEGQKVMAQTNAVLKSTKGAANVTAKEINALAGSIARQTGQSDEAIQAGQNLLLTFTKVRNEAGKGNAIFDRATVAIADMSQALGQSTTASAVQLGKALNDPVKGVTALQRVGVSFTKQQKEQITTLAESGKALEAQKIILRELETQFGGSAKAYGETLPGSIDRAKNAVGDLSESLGATLAPAITKGAEGLQEFVNGMEDGTGAGGRFLDRVKTIGNGIRDAFTSVRDFIRDFVSDNREQIDSFISDLKSIGDTVRDVFDGFVIPTIRRILPALKTVFDSAIGVIRGAIQTISGILTLDFGKAWEGVKTIVSSAIRGIGGVIRGASAPFREAAAQAGRAVSKPLGDAFDAVKSAIGSAIAFILRRVSDLLGGLSSFASAASKIPVVGRAFKGVGDEVNKVRDRLDRMADEIDGVNKKPVRIRVYDKDLRDAITDAKSLKDLLSNSDFRLTPTPRSPVGDVAPPASSGGNFTGLTAGARSGYSSIARLFGGVRLTSGFRTPAQNAAVGGAKNSDHLTGNAIDLVPSEGWSPRSIARFDRIATWARRQPGVRFIGWRGVPGHGPGDHLHISFLPKGRLRDAGDPIKKYTLGQMKGFAAGAGIPAGEQSVAAAIAMGESGGNPKANAVNRLEDSRGLWQINTYAHPWSRSMDLYDPRQNARAMARVSGKGRNWRPWTVFTSGKYRQFLAGAQRATGSVPSGGGGSSRSSGGGSSSSSAAQRAQEQAIEARRDAISASREDLAARPAAELALAALTPGSGDDLRVLRGQQSAAVKALEKARKSGSFQKIRDAASELKQVNDQIDALVQQEQDAKLEAARAAAEAANTRLDARAALARLTAGTEDDLAVLSDRQRDAQAWLDSSIRTGNQEGIRDAATLLKSIQDEIAGLRQDAEAARLEAARAEAARQVLQMDADLAVAKLTEATDDDLEVLRRQEQAAAAWLQASQAVGNLEGIRDAATQLAGVRDQIEGLTQAVNANAAASAQLVAELERQRADDAAARARLAGQQTTDLGRALVDFVNGQIGGRTGLGFQSVGFAGGGARY